MKRSITCHDFTDYLYSKIVQNSSSSSYSEGKYDVFLSFRGTDTRHGFTDYLYNDLVEAGIYTFRDSEKLQIGEEIGHDLLKAIEDSKIWILIFSENYADSKWCLIELAHIIKCQLANKGRKIYPIFYDVDVDTVKNQQGSFKKAFQKHEKKFDEKTVQEWKEALKTVVQFKGYSLKRESNGHERLLVKKLVKDVLNYAYVSGKYKVFLNFTSKDTCEGFTDLIYTNLVRAGICTIKEDNELRNGEEIGSDLLEVIKGSEISIPIFSKNYASNKWCVRELAHMVECHKTAGQRIVPIFYDVDPSDVRHQKGSYDRAFRQHRKNFDKNTVQEWKDAMTMGGEFEGFKLNKETPRNGELVKIISKVVFWIKSAHVTKDLVGMDHHVEEMERLVDANYKGVRIIGIHGMGGIGKTTIAKAMYSLLCERFEYCCFLMDVRRVQQDRTGIVGLQNELLSALMQREVIIYNMEEGSRRIRDAARRKVLLVLDNVDDISQFDCLVGECDSFGAGSRILVTTRDKGVLDRIGEIFVQKDLFEAYKTYEPNLMNEDHSLQLFCKYAFKTNYPPEDYLDLCKKVVSNTAGIPLILITYGSRIFGCHNQIYWKQMLKELETFPDLVLERLRISFEALRYEEKQIFLDIACFHNGEDIIKPRYMWDACRFDPHSSINTLVLRSLIKVGKDNMVRMNHLLRCLGREIVRDEDRDLKKCSRVWLPKEALHVLKVWGGTKNVEALSLDLGTIGLDCQNVDYEFVQVNVEGKNCYIHRLWGEDFHQLPKLRFLRLGYAFLDGDYRNAFSKLISLEWKCCGKFMPMNLYLENLVILDLSNSTITDEWKGWTLFKTAKKLKFLNLSSCVELKGGPWREIREVGGVGGFDSLEHLDMSCCYSLERLPDLLSMENLKCLSLRDCKKLRELEGVSGLVSLEILDIQSCISIVILPDLAKLTRLNKVLLKGCENLSDVRALMGLETLTILDMGCCDSVEILPNLSSLRGLKKLSLNDCKLLHEIEGFSGFVSLEILDIQRCTSIERLPDMSNLRMLKELLLKGCKNLLEVVGLGRLESLEHLDMGCCESLERLPDLSNMRKLSKLSLGGCRNLHTVEAP